MSDELKPCPFCGRIHQIDEDEGELFIPCVHHVHFLTAYEDEEKARRVITKRWNTRPIEDELNARIAVLEVKNAVLKDALKEVLHIFHEHPDRVLAAHASILMRAQTALADDQDQLDRQTLEDKS